MDERYHRRQARHHLRELGIDPDDVAKLYPQLAAGKPGPPKKGNDEDFLEGLEWHLRESRRDKNAVPHSCRLRGVFIKRSEKTNRLRR